MKIPFQFTPSLVAARSKAEKENAPNLVDLKLERRGDKGWNASQGVFCRPCGKALVARLKRGEQDQNVTAARAFLDDDAVGDF